MSPADRESSYRAIERLIATYAELVDDGDFAAVGRLLADATFTGGAGAVSGGDAIEKVLRDIVIVYEPRGIALDASFGRVDDPIASGFGHFRASRPSG
jgi:ketosteroid isomerase-like protein